MENIFAIPLLIIFGLVSFLLKIPHYKRPMEPEGEALEGIARDWKNGGALPYRDFEYGRMPGLVLLTMLTGRLFGLGARSSRVFFNVYNLLTLLIIFLLGQKMVNEVAGLVAAGLFALYSCMPSLDWHRSSEERYCILPTALSVYFVAAGLNSGWGAVFGLAVLSGFFGGISFLFQKRCAIISAVLLCTFVLPGWSSVSGLAGFILGFFLITGTGWVYFCRLHHTPLARMPIRFDSVGNIVRRALINRSPAVSGGTVVLSDHLLLVLFGVASVLVTIRYGRQSWVLMTLWGVAAWITGFLGPASKPSRWISVIPPACVMGGHMLSGMTRSFIRRGVEGLTPGDWLSVAVVLVIPTMVFYRVWKELSQSRLEVLPESGDVLEIVDEAVAPKAQPDTEEDKWKNLLK